MSILPGWDLYCIETDENAKAAREYLKGKGLESKSVALLQNFSHIGRMNITPEIMDEAVQNAVCTKNKVFAFYGSGYFHHYTYGLCSLADRHSSEYGYIHIAHHSDYGDSDEPWLCCGGFVSFIKQYRNARRDENLLFIGNENLLFIGTDAVARLKYISEGEIRQKGASQLEQLLDSIPNEVYVTIDLDIMHKHDAITDFTQGNLRREELNQILKLIRQRKDIIGADVLGFAQPAPVLPEMGIKTLQLYEDSIRALIGI
ncbi:MAG: arginase family protein [Candidatus Nanoarchaeia archaeon]|jgi:arginase family enzyme